MMDGQGPLNPQTFLKLDEPVGLRHVSAIDDHILAGNCSHPRPLKELVFRGKLEGSSPLLLACHYGQFDSVKHIVECWGVDLNAAATYYLHPSPAHFFRKESKIETATPIFVAAFNGHSKIVRYLLEKGADVNVKTSSTAKPEYDGLSPLYGAVSEHWMSPNRDKPLDEQRTERGAIVSSLLEFGADISASFTPGRRPLWMKHLCGVDATAALISCGMDLTKPGPYRGQTILHYWVSLPRDITEEDSLTIVKLLLNKGADLHVQDEWGFTPILEAANSLKFGSRPNLTALDYLLERDDVTREEKIEALELAGAAILGNCSITNQDLLPKAFDYWRRALYLRQIKTEESGPIIKTPLARLSGGQVEWVTLTQIEEIIQQPFADMIQQSLLVRLRIFSGKSWIAVESLISPYFEDLSIEGLEHTEQYDLILEIAWAFLDSIRLFDRHQKRLWQWTVLVASYLTHILSTLEREHDILWNNDTIKTSLQLILATDQFHLDNRESFFNADRYSIELLFQVVKMLTSLPEMQNHKTMEWLFKLVHRKKPEEYGTRLLHMVCKEWWNISQYSDTIRLLLDAGADPNAVDEDGNAPLHVVARVPRELIDPAVRLLLESGAHLDRVNNAGKTAADIWIECNEMEDDQVEDDGARWNARPDWCRAIRSLSCLSTRVIRSNDVPYSEGDLPARLLP